MRGVTLKVLPLSRYEISATLLSLLEKFLELMLWKFRPFKADFIFENNQK
jgi:hypothetical protein